MPVGTRTYLTTDWQLWSYVPVAGKFRLDFSKLNDSSVLGGSSDLGSIGVFDLAINSIEIREGGQPSLGVLFSFTPGTLSVSAQLPEYDEAVIQELYNGKEVYLTLKNESSYSHPVFGKNTIYFIGTIDSLDIQIDPQSNVTNIFFTAVDGYGTAMNQPITIDRYGGERVFQLQAGIQSAQARGLASSYLNPSGFGGGLSAFFEQVGATNQVMSFGELLDDSVTCVVSTINSYYFQDSTGLIENRLTGQTIPTNSLSAKVIDEELLVSVDVANDGANLPSAFNLSNSTSVYSVGIATANTLTNQSIYTASLDVPTANLKLIADKIKEYMPKIQPVSITIKTAQNYQPISFTPFVGSYFYPYNHFFPSTPTKLTLTATGKTSYHFVVGTTHSITNDYWQTTLQLFKGLDA